uniref:Osteoclast-stimulating factor 1 n=1 Tax=Salarias fasciatus TaxID=181472 RepID=A0A672FAH5_SALFA
LVLCFPAPPEVVVEYDYDALHDDELTLRLGDVIKNVRYYEEDGWMEGDLNGKRGLFPDNFVKEVKKESKEVKEAKSETKEESAPPVRREKTSGNVANLVQRMSTIGIPTGGFHPHPPAASKKPKKRQCKAQFDYQPVNDDELELKVGDIIDITEEVEEGWWSGSLNGKSGLFPSNFVKELDPMADDGESNDAPAEETDGSAVDGSATPTSPPPSSGNGVIAQPKKIRGIGFGDIFKEGSVKLKARLPSPDTEEKKEKPIPSLPSAAKPAHPNTTDSQKADGDSKSKGRTPEFEYDDKTEYPGMAVFQDTGEPGWWRGEIGGEEGVFPDNFVTPISDADKEVRRLRKQVSHKPTPDPKPSKPAAPVVPPKKPIPPPGRRPGGIPPKRPDKPLAPSPSLKHNGEVPSTRPKSEYEPFFPTKVKTLSGDWGEKSSDTADLMSFDELSSTSEKLSHPTADRPKMPGRRLPTQFGGGHSPSKEASADKSFKADEEDGAKPSASTLSPSPSLHKPSADVVGLRAQPEPEEAGAQLDELRSQFKELLMSVELLKTQQTKEITDLRRALDEEIQKRVALQVVSIAPGKRAVLSTFITPIIVVKY